MRFALTTLFCFGASCAVIAADTPAQKTLTEQTVLSAEKSPASLPEDQQGFDFFEKNIRPVLIEHCYECHSSKSKILGGGLLLDSRNGLRAGGDSGPAVVVEKTDESLLIDALRYDGFEMPPSGKLPANVIDNFEKWVRMGAPDPRSNTPAVAKTKGIDIEVGRKHWAYQLPQQTELPRVEAATWPTNELDHFILAKLEEKKLQPAADASKVALVRRAYFDLIGLPPTPEQIDVFVNDSSSRAYERLVDRLLASSHFGERWGRHWLDVVRYAESVTLRGFVLKNSWRYRDYVIDSFNEDHPFDQFIIEQLAGDLLDGETLKERQRQLTATTFLMMGNTNLEFQDKTQLEMDFVDEQLDVISRGFLAQTVTCARCHDHKFDPIPTRDYYAMAGILKNVTTLTHANISKWVEVPLPVPEELEVAYLANEKTINTCETRIKELQTTIREAAKGNSSLLIPIISPKKLAGFAIDDAKARRVGEWMPSQYSRRYIGDGYLHDMNEGKGEKTLTFEPKLPADGEYEVRFAYTSGTNRATNVPVTVFSLDGDKTITVNERKNPEIDGRFVSLGRYHFEVDGQCFVIVSTEGTNGHVIVDAVQFILVAELEDESKSGNEEAKDASQQARKELAKYETMLKRLQAKAKNRPMVMSVLEKEEMQELPIHIRGNVHNVGEPVPRGFLQVASIGDAIEIPKHQSGRLQLAQWIASPQNPLTARVIVNRTWHWLFGAGLVRTVDNMGTTGEKPSHPRLLDHLAIQFVNDGWSMKKLIRRVVLSRTYRLSSTGDQNAKSVDPENRLLSHVNRRRLDAESIRDAILTIAGTIDLEANGPTFETSMGSDYKFRYTGKRRSVYIPVFRNSLPEIFEVFDFANTSMVTGRRTVSTVAPQALYFMNHPFVMEQSKQTAKRLLEQSNTKDDESLVRHAYRMTMGRLPTDDEFRLAVQFLKGGNLESDESRQAVWATLIQSLFASIDMRYLN